MIIKSSLRIVILSLFYLILSYSTTVQAEENDSAKAIERAKVIALVKKAKNYIDA